MDKKEFEHNYGAILAGVMATIGAIAFGVMNVSRTLFYPFAGLGMISTLGVAIVLDHLLDTFEMNTGVKGYKFKERMSLVGGGYFIFSVLISLLFISVIFLYVSRVQFEHIKQNPPYILILAIMASGICLFAKMMTIDEENHWFRFLVCFLVLCLHWTWIHVLLINF